MRGGERVRPCTSPVNVTEWDRHLQELYDLSVHHFGNGNSFTPPGVCELLELWTRVLLK